MFDLTCVSCHEKNTAPQVNCKECGYVLPFYHMNPFLIFQVKPTLNMDNAYRDAVYFDFQRRLHPDKLSHISDTEEEWANQHISQINQAYKALKQPLMAGKAAALYIKDPSLSLEHFEDQDIPTPDMTFLQTVMTLQMDDASDKVDLLYSNLISELSLAVNDLDKEKILTAIAKLTYVDRLRKLTQETSSC